MFVPNMPPEAPQSSWFTFEDEIGEELLEHLDQVTGPVLTDPTVVVTVRPLREPARTRKGWSSAD